MVANFENMLDAFCLCNEKYFEGKLLFPQFDLLHSYRICGYFQCSYHQVRFSKELYDFKILITDY